MVFKQFSSVIGYRNQRVLVHKTRRNEEISWRTAMQFAAAAAAAATDDDDDDDDDDDEDDHDDDDDDDDDHDDEDDDDDDDDDDYRVYHLPGN